MLTLERLKQLVAYDPTTGLFTRLEGTTPQATARHAGKQAGLTKPKRYVQLSVDGKTYLGHRLAWFYMTGEWPAVNIDHEDGNRTNNVWSNLRLATGSINQINTKMHRHNTSGYRGVSWAAGNNKWTASIYQANRRINLGYFDSKEAAYERRLLAELEYYGGARPRR
ncbi:MAG TPA: HNH endonuclease [Hymenobacter sp.]|jgi:hypothetical protein